MDNFESDTLFVALARPQTLFGVSYSYAIANAILTCELFLIFKSVWVILFALLAHFGGWLACLRDPHIFDVWLVKVQRCPRVRNYRLWRCNSYQP